MDVTSGGSGGQAGATVAIHSIKACVVYDTTTGEIHHLHRSLTLEGGREPSDAEMERAALSRIETRRRGHPGGTLAVLHIAHDAMRPFTAYRVDVQRKALSEA